jgi:predicted nucleic acid-binding Zn ribbon protein
MTPPGGKIPPPDDDSTDNDSADDLPEPPQHLAALPGMDLVRRALEEARASARGLGKEVGHGRNSPERRRPTSQTGRRRWSGPGPDSRDPQPVGPAARELSSANGWSPKVAEGTVFARWDTVVGEQIAEHAQPVALRDGVLSIAAESTAWATQLRLVQSQLLAKIANAVGDGVVTVLKITGPTAPSWRKGPRHISGRGPRDTYG